MKSRLNGSSRYLAWTCKKKEEKLITTLQAQKKIAISGLFGKMSYSLNDTYFLAGRQLVVCTATYLHLRSFEREFSVYSFPTCGSTVSASLILLMIFFLFRQVLSVAPRMVIFLRIFLLLSFFRNTGARKATPFQCLKALKPKQQKLKNYIAHL